MSRTRTQAARRGDAKQRCVRARPAAGYGRESFCVRERACVSIGGAAGRVLGAVVRCRVCHCKEWLQKNAYQRSISLALKSPTLRYLIPHLVYVYALPCRRSQNRPARAVDARFMRPTIWLVNANSTTQSPSTFSSANSTHQLIQAWLTIASSNETLPTCGACVTHKTQSPMDNTSWLTLLHRAMAATIKRTDTPSMLAACRKVVPDGISVAAAVLCGAGGASPRGCFERTDFLLCWPAL